MKSLSRVRLLATPWTAAYQAPASMGFSRQKYWSGVPLPSPKEYLLTPERRPTDTVFGSSPTKPKGSTLDSLAVKMQGGPCPQTSAPDSLLSADFGWMVWVTLRREQGSLFLIWNCICFGIALLTLH